MSEPALASDLFKNATLWRLLAVFALLALLVIAGVSRDLRPTPLYEMAVANGEAACLAGRPVNVAIKIPEAAPVSAIRFKATIQPGAPLTLTVLDPFTKREIVSKTYLAGGDLEIALPLGEAGFKSLGLRFTSHEASPNTAPTLAVTTKKPLWPVASSLQDGSNPVLSFEFPWPTLSLLWVWVALPFAAWFAYKFPNGLPLYLLTLGVCCMIASLLVWQREYSQVSGHWDADDYGECARQIANYITRPERRDDAELWLMEYLHSPNCLSSAIIAIPVMLGAPLEQTYLMFSALCGFGALLIFARMLESHLQVSRPVMLMALTLFAVHWLNIRSFARPIGDEFGLLLVTAMLESLMQRAKSPSRSGAFVLSSLAVIMPLARPPGLSYLAFLFPAIALIDAWREKKLALQTRIVTLLRLGVVPMLVLACIYINFDLFTNFFRQLHLTAVFGKRIPRELYIPSIVGAFQWFPLIWFCRGNRFQSKDGAAAILASWMFFYIAVIVAVRAPVMTRHFLPMIPVLVGLAACALESPRPKLRAAAWSLALLALVANPAAMVYQSLVPRVAEAVSPYITSW